MYFTRCVRAHTHCPNNVAQRKNLNEKQSVQYRNMRINEVKRI